ncbi:MAG: LCP family protein [Acidimicrobiia bacterium]
MSDPSLAPPSGPSPRPGGWLRRLLITFLVLANLVVFGGLAALWWTARHARQAIPRVAAEELELEAPPRGGDEPRTFLLIGSDSRENLPDDLDEGNFGDFPGQRADVIMLVRVVPDEGQLKLLSLPRDLRVVVRGRVMRINATFNQGAATMVRAVTDVTGIPIHHYVQIDFAGFASIVDALDGVDMSFPYAARDRKSGLSVPAGTVRLDGRDALAYARSRSYQEFRDGGWVSVEANDLGRIRRQQDLLVAILSAAKRPSTIGALGDLIDSLSQHVITDDQLDEDDFIQLAWDMRSLGSSNIDAVTLPVKFFNEDGVAYVVESEPKASQVLAAFRAGEPLSTGAAGPARVQVWNGNGITGAAEQMAGRLEGGGYLIVEVGNSGRDDYLDTLAVARPSALFRAEDIIDFLGFGRALPGRVPAGVDVIVIVGSDANSG